MDLVIGTIPSGYRDHNGNYIPLQHVPVIASLLIRTARDTDKEFSLYRAWLSGKYNKHPEKHYSNILKFSLDIEKMLDALFKHEIYLTELENELRKEYPAIHLELSISDKNTWETLLKDSMHYNEAKMLCTVIPLIHEFEKYIIVLPQVFDDGSFEADDHRSRRNASNFADGILLFDSEDIKNHSVIELLNRIFYQEKCRNLFVLILQTFIKSLQNKAVCKALTLNDPEEHLSYSADEIGMSPEEKEKFINDFYSTQYDDYHFDEKPDNSLPPFLPENIANIRLQRLISSDKHIQRLIAEKKNNHHKP